MEKILLNDSLFEAEKNFNMKVRHLKGRGAVVPSTQKLVWGYKAEVVVDQKEYVLVEVISGFTDKILEEIKSKDFLFFEESEFTDYLKSKEIKTHILPPPSGEYRYFQLHRSKIKFYQEEELDEGLDLLSSMEADEEAKKAFCLCFFLTKEEHLNNFLASDLSEVKQTSILLAMEFRRLYLEFLPSSNVKAIKYVRLSSIADVNKMLTAYLMIQYKKVLSGNRDSEEMRIFYKTWLKKLAPYYQFKLKIRDFLEK